MDNAPSRERLKALLVSIRDEQNRLMARRGMSKELNASFAVKLEPLKTPIYVMWQFLGYGDFPQSGTQAYWLASFKTSPPEFISECIMQIKTCEIPVDDLNLRRTLIDIYSEFIDQYEKVQ